MNWLFLLLILPVQWSMYDSIPYPGCVEDNGNTVVMHTTGSCISAQFENLKYYADRGYHVQSADRYQTTLIHTGVPITYHDLLEELACKMGVFNNAESLAGMYSC